MNSGTHRELQEPWTNKQAYTPSYGSDRPKPGLNPQLLVCSSQLPCVPVSVCVWVCVFPLMISQKKPIAGTGLACYHLVAQSLKEAFRALWANIAWQWQGILKGSTGDLEGSWND